MTRTWTRARCTTPEHDRKRAPCRTWWRVTCTSCLKFWVPSCHPCTCASLLEFTSLTLYFDLSFTILSLFFLLMHFEQHTELDNLITMQNLRTSANKGVTTPTTSPPPSQELSRKTRFSVAMSFLCVISKHKATTRVYDESLPASISSAALLTGEPWWILTQDNDRMESLASTHKRRVRSCRRSRHRAPRRRRALLQARRTGARSRGPRGLGHGRGDRRRRRRAHARRAAWAGAYWHAASSGVCTSDVQFGAQHRSAPRVRRRTTMSVVKNAQPSSHSALCCRTCPLSRVWCLPVVSRVRCLRSVCPAHPD